jgi:hypothetical protein
VSETSRCGGGTRRWRYLAITGFLLGTYAIVGGIAQASSGGVDSTPSVYSAIDPSVVLDAKTVTASGTKSATVSGGSTDAPAGATSVNVLINVQTPTTAGRLTVYPGGHSEDAFTAVRWVAGQTSSAQVLVGIGANKITVKNLGTDPATVSITVLGYYAPAGATGPAGGVLTGSYPNPGLANNSVTNTNISDGGGTLGQILVNNGEGGGTSWQTPNYQSAYTNTVVVHPTGVPTTDGAALRTAISEAFPLVVVEPGTYDLGSSPITVPSMTSIVGGGPQNTTVVFSGSGSVFSTTGTQAINGVKVVATGGTGTSRVITATSGALTLRNDDLTVQNGSADQEVVSIGSTGSAIIDGSRLSSIAGTATTFSEGALQNGSSGTLTITDSVVTATIAKSGDPADAVNAFGPVVVRDATVTSTATNGGQAFGLYAQNSGVTFVGSILADDVQVTAATSAVTGAGTGTVKAANSMIAGPAGGAVKCVASYNASYTAVSSTCT